ncbi:hypothetical protein AK88_00774 [Plasmodium fragile]|uniref:Uncharacterized protein n=1 Tax=Plasmodium fragile TaxID=5857 RepID=A0A0D9QRI4_PLAFR|nr:uncharacterized protein AK88_00774 [Plasmodium fragile]KJP89563.1 hypothetical protein AK88_00774 [Plasmodium fragile]
MHYNKADSTGGRSNSNSISSKLINKTYVLSMNLCDYVIRPLLFYCFTPLIFGYGLYYNDEFTLNPYSTGGRSNSNSISSKLINKTYVLSMNLCDYVIRPLLFYCFTPLIFGYGLYYNDEFTLNPCKLIPKILIG